MNFLKRIPLYLISTLLVIGIVYGAWFILGVTDLGNPRFGIRSAAMVGSLLFLAQMAFGQGLWEKVFRPGWPVCLLWMVIFTGVMTKAADFWTVNSEALCNYFLISFASLAILSAACFHGRHWRWGRWIFGAFSILYSAILAWEAFCYLSFYKSFGTVFSTEDMVATLLSNSRESFEYIQSHVGFATFGIFIVLFLLFVSFQARLTIHAMKREEKKQKIWQKVLSVIVILGALAIAGHFIPRSFPVMEYRDARIHIRNMRQISESHAANLKNFSLHVKPEETLAHQVPGSVILVIGESENRDHMKAFNPSYPRETTPWLSSVKGEKGFYFYPLAYSNFPNTSGALPAYVTGTNQYNQKSILDAFNLMDVAKAAGYTTWWITNQDASDDGVISTLEKSADRMHRISPPAKDDMHIMKYLKEIPKEGNQFIVIHLMGSHDRYRDRVPEDFPLIPGTSMTEKVDQYDNSVAYTDKVLETIFSYARENLRLQAFLYCSDHGEDMTYFHSGGQRFTYDMVRVPLVIYLSSDYLKRYPDKAGSLKHHENRAFTNDLVFDTLSGILNAPNTDYEPKYDLSSPAYSLTLDNALTKTGMYRVQDDPALRKS